MAKIRPGPDVRHSARKLICIVDGLMGWKKNQKTNILIKPLGNVPGSGRWADGIYLLRCHWRSRLLVCHMRRLHSALALSSVCWIYWLAFRCMRHVMMAVVAACCWRPSHRHCTIQTLLHDAGYGFWIMSFPFRRVARYMLVNAIRNQNVSMANSVENQISARPHTHACFH